MRADIDAPLRDACERIERWHGRHGSAHLRHPATAGTLRGLAEALGQPVPDALLTLLGLHDGVSPGTYPFPMRATESSSWRLLSAAEIAEEAKRLADVARDLPIQPPVRVTGPVAAQWWSKGWIPLCECGTGDLVCVDTAPPASGTLGQLLLYAHDCAERRVLQPGVAAWLIEAASDLEAERYQWAEGIGLVFANADGGCGLPPR